MLDFTDDVCLRGCGLHLDSRRARALGFMSHAHSDHIARHKRALATAATAALAAHRIGRCSVTALEYDQPHDLEGNEIRLVPAGHVLGSAMLHARTPRGTFLYSGDFKLRRSLTVPAARPPQADTLLMECTFGLPRFRFPPWQQTAARLLELIESTFRGGRQPVVLAYSLGKAQEALRICTQAGVTATLHGAAWAISRIYEQFGVELGAYRVYRPEDFDGPQALDLRQRGVLIAPPHLARTLACREDTCRIVLSGWALLPGAAYRYGADHALPLSDHADFDELLELVERVRPQRIYTQHGYEEFVEELRRRGHDARPAHPPQPVAVGAQLSLFE